MADFSALKQSIQNYIKQNGNKEITGNILQNILLSMVTTMGDGAINDNASDISDIKGDIQNINGDITDINGDITDINGGITNLNSGLSDEVNRAEGAEGTLQQNITAEENRAKGAETTTVLFSDGKLVFKNAAGTVLYQLSVDSFLSAITTRLNTGALYAGYATPSTTPATLAGQEVFYLATQAGTYTNFHFNGGDDPIVLAKDGIYFIVSGTDDDDWNAEPMLQLDDVPTASSNNAVKSGGVAEELALGAVYDVSAKNPTAGPNNDGKWGSLSALLSDANLNTIIPTSVRKGGMSIKFVQSVDNIYVQYRLMSNSFSTTVTDWQGVDNTPKPNSKNIVESGGIAKNIAEISNYNLSNGFVAGYLWNINASTAVLQASYPWISNNRLFKINGNDVGIRNISTDTSIKCLKAYYHFDGNKYNFVSYEMGTTSATIPENADYVGFSVLTSDVNITATDANEYEIFGIADYIITVEDKLEGLIDIIKQNEEDAEEKSYFNLSNGFVDGKIWDFNAGEAQFINRQLWASNKKLFSIKDSNVAIIKIADNTAIDCLKVYYRYDGLKMSTISYEQGTTATIPATATHVGFSVFKNTTHISSDNAKDYKIIGVNNFEDAVDVKIDILSEKVSDNTESISQIENVLSKLSDYNAVTGTPLFNANSSFEGTSPYVKGEYVYVDKATFTNSAVSPGTTVLPPCLFDISQNEIYIEFGTLYYAQWGNYIDLYGNRLILAEDEDNYLVLYLTNGILMFAYQAKDGTTKTDKKQGATGIQYIPKHNAAVVCVGYDSAANSVYFKTIGYDRTEHYYCFYELEEGWSHKFGIFGNNNLFMMYSSFSLINQNNSLQGKKWGAIGDSETYLGTYYMRYYNLLNKFNLCTNDVEAVGGARLSNPSEIPYYAEQIDNDCDFVTVMGGINDYALTQTDNIGTIADRPSSRNDINSVYGGVWYICKTLKERFPNKSIFFILQIPEWNPNVPGDPSTRAFTNVEDGYNTYTHKSIFDYWDAICNVCKQWSIPVIKLGANIGISFKNNSDRTKYSEDGLHPNNNGHFLEGLLIANYINNEKLL